MSDGSTLQVQGELKDLIHSVISRLDYKGPSWGTKQEHNFQVALEVRWSP